MPTQKMNGPTFEYLLVIAPEWAWGYMGVAVGVSRLLALYINGNWRRTPGLHLFGAMLGLIWWLIISALYWLAVKNGAPDFPMLYVFFVFIFFEGYSCSLQHLRHDGCPSHQSLSQPRHSNE